MTYNWCHGPNCHKSHTLDRVRGVKGNKVLRTRKIRETNGIRILFGPTFVVKAVGLTSRINIGKNAIALGPRTECLETPIEDPKKSYSYN